MIVALAAVVDGLAAGAVLGAEDTLAGDDGLAVGAVVLPPPDVQALNSTSIAAPRASTRFIRMMGFLLPP
ncbi:MAG TPA: hypothetical protein VFC81_02335 [Verrucomicrobiae bacterium]|nr:hypothetical protein [Verrucomicrobiae bacterium]